MIKVDRYNSHTDFLFLTSQRVYKESLSSSDGICNNNPMGRFDCASGHRPCCYLEVMATWLWQGKTSAVTSAQAREGASITV